ncbi:MAG: DUF4365 domain-containing protein [Anaerolineae bacterium]
MTRNGRRLTENQQQGAVAEDQLRERLDSYGWIVHRLDRDVGEDFLVYITDTGVRSGLQFLAQVKSCRDLRSLQVKGELLSLPLEVKDLVDWGFSATPVFVFVWDVGRRFGCWARAIDLIADVDRRSPHWRTRQSVRVHVATASGTDDTGLGRLRDKVLSHWWPAISRDHDTVVGLRFSFPKDNEGRAALASLERHIASGDSATIEGKYIEHIELPEWWQRALGSFDSSRATVVVSPIIESESEPIALHFRARQGSPAAIPYVELKLVKHGKQEFTATNEGQPIPWQVSLVGRKADGSFRLGLRLLQLGADVGQARDVLAVASAAAAGGQLEITKLRSGTRFALLDYPVNALRPPDPEFVSFVEDLCHIERLTHQKLCLPADGRVSVSDMAAARALVGILDTGCDMSRPESVTLAVRLDDPSRMLTAIEQAPNQVPVQAVLSEDDTFEFLGSAIGLGRVTCSVTGLVDPSTIPLLVEKLRSWTPEDEFELRLIEARVLAEYAEWPRPDVANPRQAPCPLNH